MLLLGLYAVLYLWAIAASLWLSRGVANFLATHDEISSTTALEDFKALARRNMYFALVQIGVLGLGILLGIALIGMYGLLGFVVVLVANAALLAAGYRGSRLEKRARSLPAAEDSLRQEYQHVSQSWVKKALPDF